MKRLCLLLLTAALLLSGCAPAPETEDGRIVIALVDTGISTAAIDSARILPGYNYVTNSQDTEDRVNHGTAVASILAGCESAQVAAKADFAFLVPLVVADKVDGALKNADADVLAQAIRDAIDVHCADVINLSLGVKTDTPALRNAVEYASQKDVLLIAAVGNHGDESQVYYPAAYDGVLAVGSCSKSGEKSWFSQSGADILAQGESLLLASRNGLPYGVKGTSYATAIVSALGARLLQAEEDLSCSALRQKILEAARENGGFLLLTDK